MFSIMLAFDYGDSHTMLLYFPQIANIVMTVIAVDRWKCTKKEAYKRSMTNSIINFFLGAAWLGVASWTLAVLFVYTIGQANES